MANGLNLRNSSGLGLAPGTLNVGEDPNDFIEEVRPAAAAESVRPEAPKNSSLGAFSKFAENFADNPFSALGLILTETARGAKGLRSTIPDRQRAAMQQEGLKLRKQAATLKKVEIGLELLEKSPEESHEAIAAKFGEGDEDTAQILRIAAAGKLKEVRSMLDALRVFPGATPLIDQMIDEIGPEATLETLGPPLQKALEQRILTPGKVDEARQIAQAKAKKPRPSFLDETGKVKGVESARIARLVGESLGGQVDEAGRVLNLPPKLSSKLPALVATAETKLQSGDAESIGDAVNQTLIEAAIDLPESLSDIANKVEVIAQTEFGDDPEADNAVEKLKLTDATGLTSGVKNFVLNEVIGQFFSGAVDPKVVRARQQLALLANDFIVAEKRSPRLPVWEQMRLSRIFTEPSAWRSPEQVRIQLREWDDDLSERIETRKTLLTVPGSREEKLESLSEISNMARFRARIRRFDLISDSEGLFDPSTAPSKAPAVIDFSDLP